MTLCLSRVSRTVACALVLCLCAASLSAQPKKTDELGPDEQLDFAEGNYQRKFYDLAAKEYRYFVEKFPEHKHAPHAMFRLIVCLRTLGRTEATFSAINQFQAKWPTHKSSARLFLWKGEILFNQERYAPASACFKRLLLDEDSKTQETAMYFLGQCYGKVGKPELALQTYAKLGAKPFDKDHIYRPYALFAVAVGHQQKDEFDKAAKLFQRLATEKHVADPVCEEAMCPNLGECWGSGTATFLMLGDVCTRTCGFCDIKHGKPDFLDWNEPERVAQAVMQMKLKHAVITSVNRDERRDGGAPIFAMVIRRIRELQPGCSIEVLKTNNAVESDVLHL